MPPNTVHGTSLDIFNKQVEMGPETQPRRQFMDHLCAFYLETSKPFSSMPAIGKNPLDLYKVYTLVKEKGGFQQVVIVMLKKTSLGFKGLRKYK